jgi:hypothetical protein
MIAFLSLAPLDAKTMLPACGGLAKDWQRVLRRRRPLFKLDRALGEHGEEDHSLQIFVGYPRGLLALLPGPSQFGRTGYGSAIQRRIVYGDRDINLAAGEVAGDRSPHREPQAAAQRPRKGASRFHRSR